MWQIPRYLPKHGVTLTIPMTVKNYSIRKPKLEMFSKHELWGVFQRKTTTLKLNFHESFSEWISSKRGKFEFQKLLRVNYGVKRVNLSQFSEKERRSSPSENNIQSKRAIELCSTAVPSPPHTPSAISTSL